MEYLIAYFVTTVISIATTTFIMIKCLEKRVPELKRIIDICEAKWTGL